VRFLPTGGITFDNLGGYLACGKVIACGGSFMATSDQFKAGDFEGITEACKRAADIAQSSRSTK
jgi:2-dehydro-3-deoxyphosphogluconate aldolase/(4S)-4-hydroxy-2-oxoglutarate aldolase